VTSVELDAGESTGGSAVHVHYTARRKRLNHSGEAAETDEDVELLPEAAADAERMLAFITSRSGQVTALES